MERGAGGGGRGVGDRPASGLLPSHEQLQGSLQRSPEAGAWLEPGHHPLLTMYSFPLAAVTNYHKVYD